MRLIGLLVVLAALGWLGTRALPSHSGPAGNAPAAQRVVDGARSDLQRAQTTQQQQLDRQLQGADQQ